MLYQHKKSLSQIKVISDSIYNRDIQAFCVMFTRFEDTTEELFFMAKDDFDQQFEVQYDLQIKRNSLCKYS
jgi:hypothetical protein